MIGTIHYVSFANRSGYGIAGQRAVLALLAAGLPVRWIPMRWRAPGFDEVERDLDGALPGLPRRLRVAAGEADGLPRVRPGDVVVVHAAPDHWPAWRARLPDAALVGATTWETTVLPAEWRTWMAAVDHVVVPSRWNAELVRAAGVEVPTTVVPHVPSRPLAPPPLPPTAGRAGGRLTFATVGEWTERKAMADTIEAFLRAFRADDPVRLMVKTGTTDRSGSNAGQGPLAGTTARSVAQVMARHRRPAAVEVVTADLDDAAMAAWWAATDVFVSLTHGEGFGLGTFDAATHGRPVIATGWGGSLDFLDPADALLVAADLVPVVDPTGAQADTPGQRWAQPSIDQAVDLLRQVALHPGSVSDRGRRLARRIADDFSATDATRLLLGAIDAARAARVSAPG